MDKEVRDRRADKSSWKDLESWAAYNCNIDVEAQLIMSLRIRRECLIMQMSWSDIQREKRAPHQAPVPWLPPDQVKVSTTSDIKRLTDAKNE
jgi:hypothetical protein